MGVRTGICRHYGRSECLSLLSKTIEENEAINDGFKIKADYQAEQKAIQLEEQSNPEQNQKEKRSRNGWAQDDLYD